MRAGTISVDNRAKYYRDIAPVIAADPLGFYCRAERGRQVQAMFPFNRTHASEQMRDQEPANQEYQL